MPPRGLIFTELINLVSLVQSHHKPGGMYCDGLVTFLQVCDEIAPMKLG